MFQKILIANRGEVACRIIKTAKKMNIKTVSVFSDSDRHANHVLMADESFYIGKSDVRESYLNQEIILKACKETNVEAVHPGYGFLSENAEFANLLEKNNVIFIGPPKEAISDMGDKIKSKKIASLAGVNIIPGFIGEVNDLEHATKIAEQIGFPIMIKASAGGGGKGMRIVKNINELEDGYVRASSEAKNSFGDARVFFEKFLVNPRHIEIQILADSFGNILSLGERECSIQRRNQKIIEEAPSSFVNEILRKKMSNQAIRLASKVNYVSAGTVEFIVDNKKNFYFLEMNTRLQVEHPVTELVTGIDIVEEMIKIACKQKLEINQSDIKINGWSIESRIYAEDPYKEFLPSIGRLRKYSPPKEKKEKYKVVRNDSGIKEGDKIEIYYDPMIAKLITWARTRKEAIELMKLSLDKFSIDGIKHNIPFLSSVLSNNNFEKANINTSFIEMEYNKGFKGVSFKLYQELMNLIILVLHFDQMCRDNNELTSCQSLFVEVLDEFNDKIHLSQPYDIKRMDESYYVYKENSFKINGKKYDNLKIKFKNDFSNNLCFIEIFEKNNIITNVFCHILFNFPQLILHYRGISVKGVLKNQNSLELSKYIKQTERIDSLNSLVCPMPGRLIEIFVKEGMEVEVGDKLCIVEAMKMENVLVAPKKAKVKNINFAINDILKVDEIIMEF